MACFSRYRIMICKPWSAWGQQRCGVRLDRRSLEIVVGVRGRGRAHTGPAAAARDDGRETDNVRFAPEATELLRRREMKCHLRQFASQQNSPLFDRLVGPGEQPGWYSEPKCPSGLGVDD